MYVEFGDKDEDNKFYRLAKTRERKTRDLDKVKVSRTREGKVLVEDTFKKEMTCLLSQALERRGGQGHCVR